MKEYRKIIVVHLGGMGDFCSIFPVLIAIKNHFSSCPIHWAGRGDRNAWLSQLEITDASNEEQLAIGELFTADTWPVVLDGVLVVFFTLDENPFPHIWSDLWTLHTIDDSGKSPRKVVRKQLKQLGVSWPADWHDAWADFYRKASEPFMKPEYKDSVLLFPGAGHPAKRWPLDNYLDLADRITSQGLKPLFVMGMGDLHRGLPVEKIRRFPFFYWDHVEELMILLSGACAACGNDGGPMHVAGLLRTPGIALFGPTSPTQWNPQGIRAICLQLPCMPCSKTGKGIACSDPKCLTQLSVEDVFLALKDRIA